MNCKQGDLAIVVRSGQGNEGKLVEVLAFLGKRPGYRGRFWHINVDGPCWLIRSIGAPLQSRFERLQEAPHPDAWLRPIRPGELDDETEDSRELEGV